MITKKQTINTKELNIIDLIAIATHKPELFIDNEQLKFILSVKETMVKEFANEMISNDK